MLYEIIALIVAVIFSMWLATTIIGQFLYILLFLAIIGLTLANLLGYGIGLEFSLWTFISLGVISALLAAGNAYRGDEEV